MARRYTPRTNSWKAPKKEKHQGRGLPMTADEMLYRLDRRYELDGREVSVSWVNPPLGEGEWQAVVENVGLVPVSCLEPIEETR